MSNNKPNGTGELFVKGIPIEVKNFFKAHCAKMGQSMSENIIDHMTKVAKEGRKADKQNGRTK
jgi:hypothetical protein